MAEDTSPTEKATQRLSGDEFDQCFTQFSEGIRGYLRSRLANDADAEDCFSRVFEKLWVHGSRINPAARGAWLFIVASREASLHWRKQKRNQSIIEDLSNESLDSRDDSPDQRLIDVEKIEVLRKATEALSLEQRQMIRKRFFEDLTFREIADELQLPLGTALSRLHAAIKQLRKVLVDVSDELVP